MTSKYIPFGAAEVVVGVVDVVTTFVVWTAIKIFVSIVLQVFWNYSTIIHVGLKYSTT